MGIFSNPGLIPNPPTKRPRDLAYASMERPPLLTLGALALQHAATALALIAYVLAAAHVGGLGPQATQEMLSAAIIGMAISTALQAIGGRTGSGTLLVHMPDPLLVSLSGLVCAEYGVGGMVAVCLVNGLSSLLGSVIVPRLRTILPPTVAGVVVCVGGISLVEPALVHAVGLNGNTLNGTDALLGGVTLLIIMCLSIWGNRTVKLFALLIGVLVGVALAALLGELHGADEFARSSLFGLPSMVAPSLDVPVGLLVSVALLSLMVQLDIFASVVLMQKMDDADWRRANMRMVGGGIRANAISSLLIAPLGAYPSAVSSANIALCHISRSTSRWVGLAVAGLFLLLAFMPMVSLALSLIPTAVIGAVEVYAAAYLIVSGVELITSRAMDARGIFMVGLAFVAGMGVMFLPGIADALPESLGFLARNGIVVSGLVAILLNLMFRMGSSLRNKESLHDADSAKALAERVTDFVESSGAAWGARRDAVRRAAQAALEAVELLQASGEGRRPIEIRGRFDEFNLDLEILHEGPPLELDTQQALPHDLLDADDDAFEAALAKTMNRVSHTLMQRLADRVHADRRGSLSSLRLHFDH